MSRIKISFVASLILSAFLTLASTVSAQVGDVNPLKGNAENFNDDTEESIKLRTGPGNPIAGKEKSQLCQGCHGEFGASTDPAIPKLAGQYGKYISKEVRNYQAGTRTHQIMNAMAGTLNDDDLDDIAAYFATQKKMKGDGLTENLVGKDLFVNGDRSRMLLACVNCHGVRGKGLDPKIPMFPVIGGQQKVYLRKQLIEFRDGFRTNSPNAIMNRIANSLTDLEIESLADYLAAR